LQLLQAALNGTLDIRNIRNNLGCYEELLARNPAFLDRNTQLRFGAVDLRAIEVAVAQADGSLDGFDKVAIDAVVT
jgi:hypothetical protein